DPIEHFECRGQRLDLAPGDVVLLATVTNGLITAEAAALDRRRNQLFHALLGDPIEHFECRGQRLDLAPGDVVLLAT
ncbi:hypothetical protein J8J27_35420, partial [Mycobacterium tuberculosis]|nr:hypothetical protein [Mycobacterium tuberculosis]